MHSLKYAVWGTSFEGPPFRFRRNCQDCLNSKIINWIDTVIRLPGFLDPEFSFQTRFWICCGGSFKYGDYLECSRKKAKTCETYSKWTINLAKCYRLMSLEWVYTNGSKYKLGPNVLRTALLLTAKQVLRK